MSRQVAGWSGRNDDQAIPPRVKDRIALRAEMQCQHCRRHVGGKLRAEFDHVVPLILGGKHNEDNLQLLCSECHTSKTKLDVKLKAKVARIRKKNLGIKRKPSRSWGYGKTDAFKMKIGGGIVPR